MSESGHCKWCGNIATLEDSSEQAKVLYRDFIGPKLPWYVVSPTVFVSGSALLVIFDVGTLLQGRRVFMVSAGKVVEQSPGDSGWKRR